VKVTLLGGGGFRTPLTYLALARVARRIDVDELVLHDVDADRLQRVFSVLEGLQAELGSSCLEVKVTTDLHAAVRGATVVLCAIRVGGLEARVVDERVPFDAGVIGQETVGPGGLNLVLRSVPFLTHIAQVIAREAPHAWFVNFTNPVGVMCSVAADILGSRVLGVCDTPASLCRHVSAVLNSDPSELSFDYFGLNHLGWLRAVRDRGGRDLLQEILTNDALLDELGASRLFEAELLRRMRMLPSEYLAYFYYPNRPVRAQAADGYTRAEFLLDLQRPFYSQGHPTALEALREWRALRWERERSYMAEARSEAITPESPSRTSDEVEDGYAGVAVQVIESLFSQASVAAILNVSNRGILPFLSEETFVEVPCDVCDGHVVNASVDDVPEHNRLLMQRVSAAERAAVHASRSGSRGEVIEAVTLHPLVDSVATAERIVAAYFRAQPELAERFT
jgi:6-phospho-beta-glucosidase